MEDKHTVTVLVDADEVHGVLNYIGVGNYSELANINSSEPRYRQIFSVKSNLAYGIADIDDHSKL